MPHLRKMALTPRAYRDVYIYYTCEHAKSPELAVSLYSERNKTTQVANVLHERREE